MMSWRVLGAVSFLLLFAAVLGLVVAFELDPAAQPLPRLPWRDGRLSAHDLILLLMVLTTAGALFSLWFARRSGWSRRAQIALLIVTLLAGLNYFYARMGLFANEYVHRHDTFHYLLGPRYFAELGYTDLYACTLAELSSAQYPDHYPVRDLRTYWVQTAARIRVLQPCEDNFAPDRRDRWRADLQLFTDHRNRLLGGILEDRGYNGPPFHAAVAGAIANRIPLTPATHNLVPLFDVAMLCAMVAGVVWVFGWPIGLLFGLFFFTNAADRWAIIGGSFLRYPWMAFLALSLAALHARRHATAGSLMALSALLNIFPVVFAAGIAARAAMRSWRERSLPTEYRRFFAAGLLTGVLGLGIGALPGNGLENYANWWHNIQLHNAEPFVGNGVGLKYPFTFRGGITQAADQSTQVMRQMWFEQVRPWYWALAALFLGLAAWVAARTDDDVEASGVLGFTLFFVLLGTVTYYFAAAAVMILALHRRISEPIGAALVALFFVTSLLAHMAFYHSLYHRFAFSTVLSTGSAIWLLLVLLWLAWRGTGQQATGQTNPTPNARGSNQGKRLNSKRQDRKFGQKST